MKRKFMAMGIMSVSMLALASCMQKSSADYSTVRQITTIDEDVKTKLNLFYDKDDVDSTSELLDTDTKTGSYYDLYVAKNANDSLFAYSYCLDDYMESEEGKRNLTVTVNTLSFAIQDTDAIYSEEKTAILSAAYDAEKGITSKLSVSFDVDTKAEYSKTFDTTKAYAWSREGKSITLTTVYMPVYVVHYVSNQPVLRNYVFLPIYTTFVTLTGSEIRGDEVVKSTIGEIKKVKLDEYFNENAQSTLTAAKVLPVEEPAIEDEESQSNGLSAGAIVGIVLGSVFGALVLIYFIVGFTAWRSGKLNGDFAKAIYKWIKRPSDAKKK